ncbi:MAG: hypothetical protein U0Y68_17785 [Blastocatellia bacterium]
MKTSLLFGFLLLVLLGGIACKSSSSNSEEKGGGGLVAGSASKGGCYNAYFPATETMKKTYKTVFANNTMPPSTYTESAANLTKDGFQHRMTFAPSDTKNGQTLTVEGGVKCAPEGLMVMEYGNLAMGQNTKFKFKTIKADGVTFPNESDWTVGRKWAMTYEVQGEVTGAPNPAMNMAPRGAIAMDSEIVGSESVTVPAGTFQTFKVVMVMNQKLNLQMNGRDIPMNNNFKTTAWFAKGVGMVKSQTELVGATTELVSLTK